MSSFSGTSCRARSQTARGTCCRTCLGSGPRDCMSEGLPLRAVYGGLAPFQKRLTSTTASPGTCVKVDLIKNWRPHSSNRFAIELNEVTGVEQGKIPPTDARWGFHISYLDFGALGEGYLKWSWVQPWNSFRTRLRPDQRALEEGRVAEAENIKLGVEQSQRDRRRQTENLQVLYLIELVKIYMIYMSFWRPFWTCEDLHGLVKHSGWLFPPPEGAVQAGLVPPGGGGERGWRSCQVITQPRYLSNNQNIWDGQPFPAGGCSTRNTGSRENAAFKEFSLNRSGDHLSVDPRTSMRTWGPPSQM